MRTERCGDHQINHQGESSIVAIGHCSCVARNAMKTGENPEWIGSTTCKSNSSVRGKIIKDDVVSMSPFGLKARKEWERNQLFQIHSVTKRLQMPSIHHQFIIQR
jgi:hypothetical protein